MAKFSRMQQILGLKQQTRGNLNNFSRSNDNFDYHKSREGEDLRHQTRAASIGRRQSRPQVSNVEDRE